MYTAHFIFGIVGVILSESFITQSQSIECEPIENILEGTLSDSTRIGPYYKCWKITVPPTQYLELKLENLQLRGLDCKENCLRIRIVETNQSYEFCHDEETRNPIVALSDVLVEFDINRFNTFSYTKIFKLLYGFKDVECVQQNSFHCTNISCVSRTKVCDGVQDCDDGSDEIGCAGTFKSHLANLMETRIAGVISASRLKDNYELSRQESVLFDWKENAPRAVIALLLSGSATFNGSNSVEELLMKESELKIAVDLLQYTHIKISSKRTMDFIPIEQLSMYINALLVTCHNPRHFYGHDLVTQLREQVENSEHFVHPIAYLALCNANSTWPTNASAYFNSILDSNSNYPFIKDIQAFSVMAIACYKTRTASTIENLTSIYHSTTERFKQQQLVDGSFGNNHTTALIAQALLASGQEHAADWKLESTVKYLMQNLQSSDFDFVTTYLALPLLNSKSLADIAKINCSSNPRGHGDIDVLSDFKDYFGKKKRIQYSLFVGEDKDVIHTISLKVPETFTAYEVMKTAQAEDPKYSFEWIRVSDKKYVFKIGKVLNDPEAGLFWLLHLQHGNETNNLRHLTTSPDILQLRHDDHLIMWYKRSGI